MKFINPDQCTEDLLSLACYIPMIKDADEYFIVKLFEMCGNSKNYRDSDLLKLLHLFNANITEVNIIGQLYSVGGQLLGFKSLSRGEKLFVVAFAAAVTNTRVILQYDIEQLSPKYLKFFLDTFKNIECIEIIAQSKDWVKFIHEEYINI